MRHYSHYAMENNQSQKQNMYFPPIQKGDDQGCQNGNSVQSEALKSISIKPELSSTMANTVSPVSQYTQTIRPQQDSRAIWTEVPQNKHMQTMKMQQRSMGTETSMCRDGNAQTDQVKYLNSGSNSNLIGNEPVYRSQFARQIADIPMDTSENEQTLPMDYEQSIQPVSNH